MILHLRFTGRDGSLRYRTGQVYRLEVVSDWRERPTILEPRFCPYGSEEAFWKNWEKPS